MTAIAPLRGRLDRAVLYQIYPQSFADSNDDGIGDLHGIIDRLDYLRWLGVDALWLNPCFVSPFNDAGYDIADFLHIAPRYGTNEDLAELTDQAARRGLAVVLDLVAGHTSDQHPWFIASANDPTDRRFIWRDEPGEGWVAGPGSRGQYFLPNFFPCQPALNFGYARTNDAEPWRDSVDAPGPRANIAALQEVMSYWFDLGVSGFRVDMAGSLVKDDPGQRATAQLWRGMRQWMDRAHPDKVIISEWGEPRLAVPAGFHADFFLQFGGPDDGLGLRSLWNNGAGTVQQAWPERQPWLDAEGRGDAAPFVAEWRDAQRAIAASSLGGVSGLPTANHDFTRLMAPGRLPAEVFCAFVVTLTWPSMPSVYYGDEIGMRFIPDSPTLEGSRLAPSYDRSGSRTPMQWGETGDGPFGGQHSAPSRYLPEDPDPARPTVADQIADPHSLLHHVRDLIALRHGERRLDVDTPTEILNTTYPLAYLRGGSLLIAVNPSRNPVTLTFPEVHRGHLVCESGARLSADQVALTGFGWAIVDLAQ